MPVVPMALVAFYFAFRKQFERHRRVTRWLAPIWLYVSVTGVLVFVMLRGSLPAVALTVDPPHSVAPSTSGC
jgi:putative membrane protein